MVDKLTTNGTPNTCFTESDASFIYTLNSRGDKMPPWRTPLDPEAS